MPSPITTLCFTIDSEKDLVVTTEFSSLLLPSSEYICVLVVQFYQILRISIYKLGDVGISSYLIDSLSLTNGHCPPPGRWIMKQWPAGVNSRFAEVTENDILRTQDITTANDTKKATKL